MGSALLNGKKPLPEEPALEGESGVVVVVGATVVDVVPVVVVVGATVVDVVPVVDVVGATVVDAVVAGSATGSGTVDPHANPVHASTATTRTANVTRRTAPLTGTTIDGSTL